ncbi:MAG: response regulator [Abitibacteriaceae bacterium]|nr:response regulator [Abditibacteriaceae bacterium]
MSEIILKNAKILIIDDEIANVRYLEIILQSAGYSRIQSTTDARQALLLFMEFQPDIILLDLNMPYLDGYAVMEQLQARMNEECYLPILVLTADVTPQAKRQALSQGAKDFLAKPLDTIEVLLRLHNLLQTRFQHLILEEKVQERTQKIEATQREILQRLALAAEYRDDDTGLHTKRVGITSARIAQCLDLTTQQVTLIEQTAPLHDVGKIGVPDAILLKPGKLTEAEFATMKNHTVIGSQMLAGSDSPWLQLAEQIALSHHERWDGSGYPLGLQSEAVPLVGRIVAVADVFDALTHDRPYKKAWLVAAAVTEIERQSGQQFDPQVVNAFMQLDHAALV